VLAVDRVVERRVVVSARTTASASSRNCGSVTRLLRMPTLPEILGESRHVAVETCVDSRLIVRRIHLGFVAHVKA
jgi:hypothetical protein